MKYTLLLLVMSLSLISVNGQVTMTPVGTNGDHQFTSNYPNDHLHFYLFGDGYHSFEHSPEHQFLAGNSSEANGYIVSPYDDDDIEPELIGTPTHEATTPDDLGPQPMSNMVQVKRSWNLVEGKDNYFVLMIENKNDQVPWNGCAEFHFNIDDSEIDVNDIQDEYNGWFGSRTLVTSDYPNQGYTHKFVWPYDNLVLGEQRYIYIPTQCIPEAWSIVNVAGVLKNISCSQQVPYVPGAGGTRGEGGGNGGGSGGSNSNGTDGFYELNSVVSAFPHDPNTIIPECNYLGGYTGEVSIPYRIYFQNDGADPVQNVRIEYLTYFNHSTIKLLGASHAVSMLPLQSNGGSIITSTAASFAFENIFLPGSNQSATVEYEETIGWVDFEVCYNLQLLSLGSSIDNQIDIYFDTQQPIVAFQQIFRDNNIANSRLCNNYNCPIVKPGVQVYIPTGTNSLGRSSETNTYEKLDFNLFPNPALEQLNIDLILGSSSSVDVTILDINNRIALSKDLLSSHSTLDVSGLTPGVYYVRISDTKETKVKAFVKL